MPRALKFALIGCGGLLGLLVAGACAAPIGGPQDTDTKAPVGQAEKPQEEKPQEKKAKGKEEGPTGQIGETLEVGDVAWNVTDTRRTNELSQEGFGKLGESKQGDFVVVDFLFTNNDDESVTLSQQSLSLLDSGGRESKPDTDTFGYIDPDKNVFLNQVNPGVTEDGRVIFTVSPDASGFTLQVGDARALGTKSGYVDLGF